MDVSLQELAELVGGALEGDGSVRIRRAAPLGEAQSGDITFVAQKKYEPLAQQTQASAVIVGEDFGTAPMPLIRVRDPLESFLVVCSRLVTPKPRPRIGVAAQAHVAPSVQFGADVNVFPGATIGEGTVVGDRVDIHPGVCIGDNCRIGADVVLRPNVVLYDDTVIGDRVTVHSGSVIGSDGFGYRPRPDGHPVKVPQLGRVEIGDDVEIGACTTIDRATFGATRIGAGTKIDNLVMIAHNCQIGEDCMIVSHVGIAGSSKVGDRVVLAGQVGIVDHVEIGDGAVIGAQAGVTKDVKPGETVFGSPAGPALEMKRMLLALTRLPEFRTRLRDIEKRLEELAPKQEDDPR